MFHIDCTFRATNFSLIVYNFCVHFRIGFESFIIVRTIVVSRYRAREISQKFGYNARDVLVENVLVSLGIFSRSNRKSFQNIALLAEK